MEIQFRRWLEVLVDWLPKDYQGAWTLKKSIKREGVGLHSGQLCAVRLNPFHLPGIYFSWIGSNETPIKLNPSQIRNSKLCTTIEIGNKRLSTVEHLFAALAGSGLTHVHFQVDGFEIPLLDGSALGWVEAIAEAGFSPAVSPRPSGPVLCNPLTFYRGDSLITAIPAEGFRMIGIIDFPYEAIGRQIFKITLTPPAFVNEIAPARTFGFRDQLNQLASAGLVKGGSLENALVCDGDHWINPPLRFEDEPVRHKLLDLIGDLSLVGFPNAQVLVYKGSHALHSDLASALFEYCPESLISN